MIDYECPSSTINASLCQKSYTFISLPLLSLPLWYTHIFRQINSNVNTEPSFWSSWTDMLRTMWILHHYINGNGLFGHFNCTSRVHVAIFFLTVLVEFMWFYDTFRISLFFLFCFQFNWDAGKCPMQQFVNGGDSKMWALHKPPFC